MLKTDTSEWPPLRRLRLEWVGVIAYPPSSTWGPRLLVDYEFMWIMDGSAAVYYDDKKFHAAPDSLFLARPGMRDRYDWSPRGRARHGYLHFEFDAPRAGWPDQSEWPIMRSLAADDLLKSLYSFCLTWQRGQKTTLPYRDALELMLKLFISGAGALPSEPHERLPEAVERALDLMHTSLEQTLLRVPTLNELARAARVTPEHLCRLFKRHLNVGPKEAFRLARLERAATLLSRTGMSIKEVASATGFANQYHFSNSFKSVYGVSPRRYREVLEAGDPSIINPTVRHLRAHFMGR